MTATTDITPTAPAPAHAAADAKAADTTSVFHRSLSLTLPVASHAEGNYLYLATGEKILDASGGAAVVSIGHGVPEIIKAVGTQLGTLPYVSSALFGLQPAEELAAMMCDEAGMGRAIFLSGGSEAVESAIKVGLAHVVLSWDRSAYVSQATCG
jgi:adenosylmethionine-8-amino-7-oxononanoate aminotransferase